MENASDDFRQRKKLANILPSFAGSSPPISPKTSPTSLWKSLVLTFAALQVKAHEFPLDLLSAFAFVHNPQEQATTTDK